MDTESVDCRLCGARDAALLFSSWDMWSGAKKEDRRSFQYVRCRACGLVYLNPRVRPSEVGRFYTASYVSHSEPGRTVTAARPSATPARRRTLPHWLRVRTWLRLRFEHARNPRFPSGVMTRFLVALFRRTRFARGGPLLFPGDGLELLDVGCGVGRLLARYRELGWTVAGVEPSANAVQACLERGLNVRHGLLKASDWGRARFDAVVLVHVFEHIPEPRELLAEVREVLKPDGILYMSMPNERSVASRLFRKYWIGSDVPRHYYLYGPATLSRLLGEEGFEVVEWYTLGSTSGFTAALEFWLRERLGVDFGRDAVRKHRLAAYLALPFTRLSDWVSLGDNVHILARKVARPPA
jgi:SAM-dependent methyltransferase